MCESYYLYGADESTKQWSSLVEGDEQTTCMESYYACVA